MVTLNIPCPHESGKVADFREEASDYHPLNKDEIKELLDMALGSTDGSFLSQIQGRLDQGIKGMVCPRPIDGKVAEHLNEVYQLFVDRCDEGGTSELVDLFNTLLNW